MRCKRPRIRSHDPLASSNGSTTMTATMSRHQRYDDISHVETYLSPQRNEITKEVQSHAYFPSRFLMPVLRPDMFTRDETVAEYHQLARLWHQRQQQQQSGAQASHSSSNPARVMYIRIVDTELDERQIVELPHQVHSPSLMAASHPLGDCSLTCVCVCVSATRADLDPPRG